MSETGENIINSSGSNLERQEYFLYPSNVYASQQETEVTTILGSCISVCLYDEKNKIGGINHYMLPFWNGVGLASPKYGNVAMKHLLNKMLDLGAEEEHVVAKVFGGANVIEIDNYIGLRNYILAASRLKRMKIKIIAESVGGERGRKLLFNTKTGVVRMKLVKKSIN